MAILLGKDATLSVNGAVAGVRSVTFSAIATTIDIEEYGFRDRTVYSTGYDATVSMELNDDANIAALIGHLRNGTDVTVSGGGGGWAFPAVITSIQESASIDGVVTYQVEAKMTLQGLK